MILGSCQPRGSDSGLLNSSSLPSGLGVLSDPVVESRFGRVLDGDGEDSLAYHLTLFLLEVGGFALETGRDFAPFAGKELACFRASMTQWLTAL